MSGENIDIEAANLAVGKSKEELVEMFREHRLAAHDRSARFLENIVTHIPQNIAPELIREAAAIIRMSPSDEVSTADISYTVFHRAYVFEGQQYRHAKRRKIIEDYYNGTLSSDIQYINISLRK